MWQLREIEHLGPARDIDPKTDRERMAGHLGFRAREDITQSYESSLAVGYFDSDGGFTGYGDEQADIGGRQGIGDVVGKARNPIDFDAGSELDLVAGDSWARHDLGELGIDAVLTQRLFQFCGSVLEFLSALLAATAGP